MPPSPWPDPLQPTTADDVALLLAAFWQELARLPDLLARTEHLLAAESTSALRAYMLRMMLALNGIAYPTGTAHLNTYLSISQRAAIEKTLLAPSTDGDAWLGQAVALVVIYRWYAPQLTAAFDIPYPQAEEDRTLALLQAQLPDWPLAITTD